MMLMRQLQLQIMRLLLLNLSLTERKTILQEILDGMMERKSDLAQAISEEMGAPLKMAGSAQFGAGTIHLKNTLAIIDDFKFQEIHDNITINKLPIGPVGMITLELAFKPNVYKSSICHSSRHLFCN